MNLIAAFLIIIIILLLFYIFSLKKNITILKKNLLDELKDITDKLFNLANGNLNTSFKIENSNNIKKYPLKDQIITLKKQFNEIVSDPVKRICYVGADPYGEGQKIGLLIGQNCPEDCEIIILVTSNLKASYASLRVKGLQKILKDKFHNIRIAGIFEANADNKAAYNFLKSHLEVNKKLKGIYVTGSLLAPVTAKCVQEHNRAGEVLIFCHDINQSIAEFIKLKIISVSLIKNTFAQGYDSIINLYNHITSGWKPVQAILDYKVEEVTNENIEKFWDFRKKDLLITDEMKQEFAQPLKKSGDKIKFMVFTEDWSLTYLQINAGFKEASELLKNYNAEIEFIILNQARRDKNEVVNQFESLINKAINEKYSGIITPVTINELIPFLNKAASAGIPIVTYNNEPNSLSSMLKWLNDTSKELDNFHVDYQYGHQQIDSAMVEILKTMENMIDSIMNQTTSAINGVTSSEKILLILNSSVEREEKQLDTVLILSEISNNMSEMIKNFDLQIGELKVVQENINLSSNKILIMNEYSNQIKNILSIIEDISSKTKILAFNSTVEAVRAGEYGKGFKIIADEIRKLSEETNKSTKNVEELIVNIQKIISESSNAMIITKDKIDSQLSNITDAVKQIENATEKLINSMNTVKVTSEENKKNILDMQKFFNELSEIINQNSSISQENCTSIEEVFATISEMASQFNQMNNQLIIITDFVKVLKGTVAQFYTE